MAAAGGRESSIQGLTAMRILFGAVWFVDGILKWGLLSNGHMRGVIQGYGVAALSSNWLLVGIIVAVAETAGGLALVLGVFQRLAALASSVLMLMIWSLAGYGGLGSPGQTDLGGDLMLALAFAFLVFAPDQYGLASRLGLSRWNLWPTLGVNETTVRPLATEESLRTPARARFLPRLRSDTKGIMRLTPAAWVLVILVACVGAGSALIPRTTSGTGPVSGANMHVTTTARDWSYSFQYTDAFGANLAQANGANVSVGTLWVPLNGKVDLSVTSADTHHSVSIPDLGVNVDAVLGVTHHVLITLPSGTQPGARFAIMCEFPCGSGHGAMVAWLVVGPSSGLLAN